MDRFREMTCFVAVVEAGSFVAASESLRVSKAAVSRAVVDLETRLGARLIQRTTRRLSITEAGRAYYGRCKQILAEVDEADGAVGEVTGHPTGTLRINAPFSFGIRHLAPLWGPFMARYPDVALEIDLSDRLVDVVKAALIDIDMQVSHRLREQSRSLTREREDELGRERELVETTLGAALAQLAEGDLSVRVEPASVGPHREAAHETR